MKFERVIKKLFVFLVLFSALFFIVEKNHDCSGDGCLTCLCSTYIYLLTDCLLAITFIPFILKKTILLTNFFFHHKNIENGGISDNRSSRLLKHRSFELSLVESGVKIQ